MPNKALKKVTIPIKTEDIKNTGQFLCKGDSYNKFFAKSAEDANWFGDFCHGSGNFTIMQGETTFNPREFFNATGDTRGHFEIPGDKLGGITNISPIK